jgi:glutamyl-tRNA synthetase
MTKIITRFAPSPTGNLHIVGARAALINFICKSQNINSKLYLRIEDTDKKRSTKEFKDNILNGLKWLGIDWDNEPQIQSQNINRHLEIANKLLTDNKAYKCICDEKELNERRKKINSGKITSKKICISCEDSTDVHNLKLNYVVRIKIPLDGNETLEDIVQGNVVVKMSEIDDYILVRKDGTPTYMLSVVVDDHDIGVNLIIRGDDHLNNYFRQKFIYKYMNWELPKYAHIPLIHGEDGSKLSKRHGAVNLIDLKEKGYLPDAIINNLIFLGWYPKNQNDEIIQITNILSKFNIKELSNSASIFSYKKLDYFNNYYLRQEKNLGLFINYCQSSLNLRKYIKQDKDKLIRIFNIYKKDISRYEEMINIAEIYFNLNFETTKDEKFQDEFDNFFDNFLKVVKNIENWEYEIINSEIKDFLKKNNIKFPILGKPVRYLLTNNYNGPSISDIFMILGKDQSLERLNKYKI